jgi:sugar phosphate isomerase/epimerase
MSNEKQYTRREFAKTAAGTVGMLAGAAPAGQAAGAGTKKPAGRPKIGCVSWCFHSFAGGSSLEPAIEIMGEIGFEGTDLILLAREDIQGFWTDAKIGQIKKQLEQKRMEVAQFVIFQPVVEGLTSTDPEERKRNLDYFDAGCRIGKKLGAPIIDIVAPWPRELRRPGGGYLPRYYDLPDPKPGEKFHIDIAPGFDWEKLWQTYIDTTKACLERVKAHGMKLTIEHHTHTMIPDAVSFLRLWDAIRDSALGYNLDTGWTMSQREYPPVAIHKVNKRLMNLHVRDIDGLMRAFVHVGTGVMDFKAIADALKAVGFQGFLSIEQDAYPGDMKATCQRYLSMMKEYLG